MRALFLAFVLLAGCSAAPRARLVNEAGVSLGVHVDGRSGEVGWQDKVVMLPQDKQRRFQLGALVNQGRVSLELGGCEYVYEEAYFRRVSSAIGEALVIGGAVRRGRDGAPYLVPITSFRRADGKVEFGKLEEHPVLPTARNCAGVVREPAAPTPPA